MAECALPGVPASAAVGRGFVHQVLADIGAECADAELCASELAANAVCHSLSGGPGGTFTLRVTIAAGTVRIEVRDAGTADTNTAAVPASPPPLDAEGGRGLWLVEALSARCGFAPGLAWCELEREAGASAVTGRAAA